MLAVGLAVDARELASLLRLPRLDGFRPPTADHRPALVAGTLAAHWLILPPMALAIAAGLGLDPLPAAALLLLAACPVGDIVNYYTLIGRGSVPLSVTLNGLSCLIAPITMGLGFACLAALIPGHLPLRPPSWPLALRVLFLALIPIAIGLGIRARSPRFAARRLPLLGRLAGISILGVLAWGLARQRDWLSNHWAQLIPALLAFFALTLIAGLLWARLWRLTPPDALPTALTFPVRNAGLAAALATTLNRPELLAVIALYFLVEVPLFLAGTRAWARWRAKGLSPTPDCPRTRRA